MQNTLIPALVYVTFSLLEAILFLTLLCDKLQFFFDCVNSNLGEMLGHGILRRLKAPLESIMLDNLNMKIMFTQRKRKLMKALRKFPKGSS